VGKLRPDYFASGTILVTSIDIPIMHNAYETVWVIEQIAVKYSVASDHPQVTVMKNSQVFSGAAQFLQGSGGLAQTFAGQPYLYQEVDDAVTVRVEGGTAGALVTVQAQIRVIDYNSPELEGRF
jgi:hypothetical protein